MNRSFRKFILLFLFSSQLMAVGHNTKNIIIIPNPYEVLGVERNASDEDIKQAYRQKSLDNHPDRNRDQNAVEMMKKINNAKDILKSKRLKADFDKYGYILKANRDLERKVHEDEELSYADWLKFQFEVGLKQGAKAIPVIIALRGVSNFLKKWIGVRTRSECSRENLLKKIVGYQYLEDEQERQKDLQDELKEMMAKVMATQKSLINDDLDEAQREKLRKRLKKYMSSCEELKEEMEELRDDNQEDFKAFLKKLNK